MATATMQQGPIAFDEIDLIASICRESFWDFICEFWETVPGAGIMVPNWHMKYIADELQDMAEDVFASRPRKYDRVINVSPGTSKSTICSILFQPWTWTRMPTARHLNASYATDLVLDLAYKSREVIRSEKYNACFPEIELCTDRDAVSLFRNTHGGDRFACTVAGKSPMGFHAHFILVDDPLDPKRVASDAELLNARDFIRIALPTRKVDKVISATALIMQRLGRGDPSDVMLERNKREQENSTVTEQLDEPPVRHVCIPAEDSYPIHPPELKEYYVEGLMDPGRLPRHILEEYFRDMGPYAYAAQFGQSPQAMKGGMFEAAYFNKRVKAAPYTAKRIRYWDRAATQDGGCATAGTLIAKDAQGNYYIEHCVHVFLEPNKRNNVMRATALADRARYGPKNEPVIWVEAEGGSSGRDAWMNVMKALEGFNVREDHVTGDKDSRAEGWSAACAAGIVYIVDNGESQQTGKATWDYQGYIDEHCQFKPDKGKRGRYKDRVDSSSGAFNLLTGARQCQAIKIYSLGKKQGGPRIVVCGKADLANVIIEEPSLLISLADPAPVGPDVIPMHALNAVLDMIQLKFIDLQASEAQDTWHDPIAPYDKKADELIMAREHGKRLWAFLLKQRGGNPLVYVIQDEGGNDRRAMSVAHAVCNILHLPIGQAIYQPSCPDISQEGKQAPNQHIFDMTKACRGMVM